MHFDLCKVDFPVITCGTVMAMQLWSSQTVSFLLWDKGRYSAPPPQEIPPLYPRGFQNENILKPIHHPQEASTASQMQQKHPQQVSLRWEAVF